MRSLFVVLLLAIVVGCGGTPETIEITETVQNEPPSQPSEQDMSRHDDGPSGLSKGSWGQGGFLFTQQSSPTVGLQAIFPNPGNYTVQFGIGSPGFGIDYEAQAEIVWKVHGNPVRRVVSVGNGTSITAPAEAVGIIVSDVTFPTGTNVGKQYPITITVAPGTRFGGPNILAGESNQQIAHSGTTAFPIPDNSGVVGVLLFLEAPSAAYSWNLLFRQLTAGGVTLYSQSIQGEVSEAPAIIPLAPGATQIEFINFDSMTAVTVGFNWQIDG